MNGWSRGGVASSISFLQSVSSFMFVGPFEERSVGLSYVGSWAVVTSKFIYNIGCTLSGRCRFSFGEHIT